MKKNKNSVAIVIVNWNGVNLLKKCLGSLKKQTYKDFKIFIVDNGSSDGSLEYLERYHKEVVLIKLDSNTGFAYPNNLAIKEILNDKSYKWIITLNNDTLVDKNFIYFLVKKAESEKNVGSVSPKMLNYFDNKKIDGVGIVINRDGGGMNRGYKENDFGQYDKDEEIFGSCAGAALYNVEMIKDIMIEGDFFDSDFFAYYEDLDVAWRARLRGWKSFVSPESLVLHVHSATSISYSPFKAFHVNRNRFLTVFKNYPMRFSINSIFIGFYRYCLMLLSLIIKTGPSYELSKKTNIITPFIIAIKSFFSFLFLLAKMHRKRSYIQKRVVVSNAEINSWFEKYGVAIGKMVF